jgi:hypothetical protein
MRYHEIFEVRGSTSQAWADIARIDDEMAALDRPTLIPRMYGCGPLDSEVEDAKLEAVRLANERERLEIERLRVEIDQERDTALDDALTRAKIEKTQAEAMRATAS